MGQKKHYGQYQGVETWLVILATLKLAIRENRAPQCPGEI